MGAFQFFTGPVCHRTISSQFIIRRTQFVTGPVCHSLSCGASSLSQTKFVTGQHQEEWILEEENQRIQVVNEESQNPTSKEGRITKLHFMGKLRAETRENSTRTVKRLYDAGVARQHRLAAHEGGVRPDLPSFLSVKSMLRRARSREFPQLREVCTV
ncbi:hypothetical protein ElyMa_000471100 [Elysia marginata]|uniref:Uncharacterized protein n=1 Tax=Elysia marginata TaxID=1093978 RepID=A0AAV4FS44_9GAST|nr:hypothetical protein ElyMa_000471100 [Elysia marginata]